jgi:hypothetical protein
MVSRVGEWMFNNSNIVPPPNGQLRLNTTAQPDATKMWVSKMTATSVDATSYLLSVMAGQEIYFQDKDNFTKWQVYRVTAPPIPQTNHIEYPVVWVRGGGIPVPEQRIFLAIDEVSTAEVLASPYVYPSTTAFGISLGLTIRQFYAGQAMTGFIASNALASNLVGRLPDYAFRVADSMIEYERQNPAHKPQPNVAKLAGTPKKMMRR